MPGIGGVPGMPGATRWHGMQDRQASGLANLSDKGIDHLRCYQHIIRDRQTCLQKYKVDPPPSCHILHYYIMLNIYCERVSYLRKAEKKSNWDFWLKIGSGGGGLRDQLIIRYVFYC